jgi:tetratricopeptide (TPR) repeat protein
VDGNVAHVRYKAFISYSHRDSAVARWLHRALETYRVPRHLIGRTTAAGEIQRRLGALFRDRDELPVAADLTGQINDALKATQFLIVLCSTASAQSKWVNQEVINFKRLKGAGSIIAVIVDGEPYASAMPGRETEECFVPALRFQVDDAGHVTATPAEPIAADLRPGKDGKRLVKLKVLAGLLGVGLDELVQRENQRRQRFMAAVTFASLAGVGIMGALTFNAIESRNEAETKREQAEGLVEYMLSDLGDRLQAVGRLDVLDSLSKQTLEYYARQKPEELDSDALGRRARALILLGKIEDQKGNREAARAAFMAAEETTRERLARDSSSANLIYDHAQSIFWLANTDVQGGQILGAEIKFREYAQLAERLVRIDPINLPWQAELAYAKTNLGALLYRSQRFDEAVIHFSAALQVKKGLHLAEPQSVARQLDLGQSLAWLADTARSLGNLGKARALREEEIQIYETLRLDDPRNVKLLQPLQIAKRQLGLIAFDQDNVAAAVEHLAAASAIADGLSLVEPNNTIWQERQGRLLLDLSEALLFSGRHDESATALARGEKIAQALVKLRPDSWRWQVLLRANSAYLSGLTALRLRNPARAIESLTPVIDALAYLARQQPNEPEISRMRARILMVQGDLKELQGLRARAVESWQAALSSLASERLQLDDIALEMQIRARLDQPAEVAMLSTQLQQTQYRRPGVDVLKQASLEAKAASH